MASSLKLVCCYVNMLALASHTIHLASRRKFTLCVLFLVAFDEATDAEFFLLVFCVDKMHDCV